MPNSQLMDSIPISNVRRIEVTDIDDPSSEINGISGNNHQLLLVTEANANVNEYTLYAWDSANATAENVPYTVDAANGDWVAIAGKYQSGDRNVGGVQTVNYTLADPLFYLNSQETDGGTTGYDQGIVFNRGAVDGAGTRNKAFIWDESADEFALIQDATEDGTTAGNLTIDQYEPFHIGALTSGDITIEDATPQLTFKDTDASAGDANFYILAAATDTGDGTEDIDVSFVAQSAGAEVTWLFFDADGSTGGRVDISTDFELSMGSQDYLFTDQSNDLAIQSQTSATGSTVGIYSKDGDATDNVGLDLFGRGLPSNITNRERLRHRWNGAASSYEIFTEADGTGTLRPLALYTEGNANQLYLATDGKVGIGTDSPDKKIDIESSSFGVARISRSSSGGGADLEFDNTTDLGFWRIERTGTAGANQSNFRISQVSESSKGTVSSTSPALIIDKDAQLDLYGGTISILAGADNEAKTRTDQTAKYSRIASPAYLNAEEPVALIFSGSTGSGATQTANDVMIGGGTNKMNAATTISFYAASNATTTTGTEVARFEGGAAKATMMGLGNSSLEAWNTGAVALQVGDTGALFGVGGSSYVGENAYYSTAGSWRAIQDDGGSLITQNNGAVSVRVFTAPAAYAGDGSASDDFASNTTALTIANDASATFGGWVYIPEYLYHDGDTNTYIGFPGADQFRIQVGGQTALDMVEASNLLTYTFLDDSWLATTSANLFKYNSTTGVIDVGATLNIGGSLESAEDSGAVTIWNMPVSSTPAAGTEMSGSMMIDSEVIAKFYATADGTGGIENQQLHTLNSGHRVNVTTVNAATYDLLGSDYVVHVTYTQTGAVTSLTLPTAQTLTGRYIHIKDAGLSAGATGAGTNSITIDTQGSETIDGAATYVISTDWNSVSLYSDGSDWFIV